MKAIPSILLLAGLSMGLVGCSSSEEPAVTAPKGDITITVNAPVASATRSAVTLPQGYTMKCVLQLLDGQNNKVGEQKTANIDAATGKGTFTITAADQESGVKALFWAQYVDATGKSIYNTADLTAVEYTTEGASLNIGDAAAAAAADAFCGKLDALTNGVNVTLTRPFANINFAPTNTEAANGATKMVVTYTAPSAFNVYSGEATGTTAITLTNEAFDPSKTPWFSSFVFAPVSQTSLESPVEIKLTGDNGFSKGVTVPAGKIPLNGNYEIGVKGEIGEVEVTDITINFEINNEFDKPEAPKFEVGAYVNAAGEPVATAEEAAGIVFNVGALSGDAIEKYDSKFADKTIKGYAVALKNVENGRQVLNTDAITGLSATTCVNGSEGTSSFLTSFDGSAFATTFTNWKSTNPTSGDNVTEWYIPSLNQLTAWLYMLYPTSAGDEATGSEAFKALFPQNTIFDRDPIATVNYASCTINNQGNISGVRMNAGETPNAQSAGISVSTATNQSALCRPMITIFE